MKRFAFVLSVIFLVVSQSFSQRSQERDGRQTSEATVEVLAYDDIARKFSLQKNTDVLWFMAPGGEDYSKLFREGIAERIPYGSYLMKVSTVAGIESRIVRVFQRNVRVFTDKTPVFDIPYFYGPPMHGRVIGFPKNRWGFVKVTGVFSSSVQESAIAPDGSFDFDVWLLSGPHMLMVVTEDGIVASRQITLPYKGPALQIEIGKDRAVPKPD